MKLLYISNLYKPFNRGGAERVCEEDITRYHKHGNKVILITARPWKESSLFPRKVTEDGVCIWHYYPLNLFFYLSDHKYPAFVRFFWHVIDVFNMHTFFVHLYILNKERPDIVYTHNLKGLGYLIPFAIRILDIKHIHTVHDLQLITPSGIMLYGKEKAWEHTNLLTKIYRWVCKKFFGSPKSVQFPSSWIKGEYEKYGFFPNSNLLVTPNQIELIPFYSQHSQEVLRLLYIGQIEEHKGVDVFLEAVKNITDIEVHVYGKGSLLGILMQKYGGCGHIKFFGNVEKIRVFEAYKSANALVYPSLCYENSPMAVVEAKAFGLRVIASNIGGIPELLDDRDILITPGNVEEIKQAIEKIHPTKRVEIEKEIFLERA